MYLFSGSNVKLQSVLLADASEESVLANELYLMAEVLKVRLKPEQLQENGSDSPQEISEINSDIIEILSRTIISEIDAGSHIESAMVKAGNRNRS